MHSVTIENKVIMITGAFGLLGKTISKAMLDQNAKVIIADINSNSENEVKNLLKETDESNYLIVHLDITKEKSCIDAIDAAINKFGKIDVLINNAAIDAKFDKENIGSVNQSRFELYPMDLFKRSVDVNINGTVLMTQVMCRQMLKQGFGNIINVASTYSLVSPNQSLYDFGDGNINYKPVDYIVTKSFIPNFTKYIATFYAKENIRCNAIAPHGIFNDHSEAFIQNFSNLSPMGRMADKNELIGPFTFLASDASSYMTGSILTVDGGWTAW